ncbi:MAG: hypothetical protein AUI85_11805 [Acidobacteriales bacterium 13_1_40CM_3_55_5]|nr:MAG: hypothetical protein AUI85_11805 [Acidobacteriales bacterium 13_1_40CM_3_55_5]
MSCAAAQSINITRRRIVLSNVFPRRRSCKVRHSPATIVSVKNVDERDALAVPGKNPFQPRTMVVLTLVRDRVGFI